MSSNDMLRRLLVSFSELGTFLLLTVLNGLFWVSQAYDDATLWAATRIADSSFGAWLFARCGPPPMHRTLEEEDVSPSPSPSPPPMLPSEMQDLLFRLCQTADCDAMLPLLEKVGGSSVLECIDAGGNTPLLFAIKCMSGKGKLRVGSHTSNMYTPVVSMLLEKGANIEATDKNGDTPLHVACVYGCVSAVVMLLAKGARVTRSNNKGESPLFASCGGEVQFAIVSLLVGKGADVEAAEEHGFTPLYVACLRGFFDIVSFLIEKGADVNKHAGPFGGRVGSKGGFRRCLDIAVEHGHEKIVALLLAHGADATADPQGRDPLDIAQRNGRISCAAMIKAHRVSEEKTTKTTKMTKTMQPMKTKNDEAEARAQTDQHRAAVANKLAEAAANAVAMELLALEDAGEAAKSSKKKKNNKEKEKEKKKEMPPAVPSQPNPPQEDAWESFLAAMRLDELAASRDPAAE